MGWTPEQLRAVRPELAEALHWLVFAELSARNIRDAEQILRLPLKPDDRARVKVAIAVDRVALFPPDPEEDARG
jgi:hypothetical protein